MRIVIPEQANQDSKGFFIQIATANWKQLKQIGILKDKERGGHYHKNNEEWFLVQNGRVEVKIQGQDKTERIYFFRMGDMFVVEKGEKDFDGAIRELKEETGIDYKILTFRVIEKGHSFNHVSHVIEIFH